MSGTDTFQGCINDILSIRYLSMSAAAGAWIALAQAAAGEGGTLSHTAGDVSGASGVGLRELSDRLSAASGWADGASAMCQRVAEQFAQVSESAARATERAMHLREEYGDADEEVARIRAADPGGVGAQAAADIQQRKNELVAEAEAERARLNSELGALVGGEAPPAPEGGAGGGGYAPALGGGAAAGAAAAAHAGGAAVAPDYAAPNGAVIGPAALPYGHVLGPEHGDFAGWVLSPNTGYVVDPATGREFDTGTGRWVDPVTGQPFGEATEYANRYSGLDGMAMGAVGLAGAAGMAGLARLYHNNVPPSVAHAGAARGQMARQATHNLGQRAAVANRFALHEAAQGGRPFVPPPGAAGYRGGAAPVAGTRGGGAVAAGNRAGPPPAPGAGRAAGRAAAPAGRAGSAAAAAARHRLTGTATGVAPAVSRGAEPRDETPRQRPTRVHEDPAVWTPDGAGPRAGLNGVLGEPAPRRRS